MRLLECLFFGPRWQQKQWIDVLVDLDETLVYSKGLLQGPGHMRTYNLVHGGMEFLVALDNIPGVRVGLYSCGAKLRNENLSKVIVATIEETGYSLKQKFEVFSVAARVYGKKRLKGLRRAIDLSRAILVDDAGTNVEKGEEPNLLKIYEYKKFQGELTDSQKVYKARVVNNLVRALGMILKAIDLAKLSAGSMTEVQALQSLQWDSTLYLHETSNTEEIYQLGLQAMQCVNPNFSIHVDSTDYYPWVSLQEADLALFPKQWNLIIQETKKKKKKRKKEKKKKEEEKKWQQICEESNKEKKPQQKIEETNEEKEPQQKGKESNEEKMEQQKAEESNEENMEQWEAEKSNDPTSQQ